MKQIILILLILLIFFNFEKISFSQNLSKTDSLENLIYIYEKEKNESLQNDLINKLFLLFRNNNVKKAIFYCKKGIELGEKLNDPEIEFNWYVRFGITYESIGASYLAMKNFQKAMFIAKKNNLNTAWSDISFGNFYYAHSSYEKAKKYYTKAIENFKKFEAHNKKMYRLGTAVAINNIGMIYNAQEEYNKSLKLYKKAYRQRLLLKLNYELSHSCLLIGSSFKNANKIDSALFYYSKGIEYGKKTKKKQFLMEIHIKKAEYFSEKGDIDSALMECKTAEQIAIKTNILFILPIIYLNYSKFYYHTSEFKKSLNYALIGKNISDSLNNNKQTFELLKQLISVNEKLDNISCAYKYLSKYQFLKEEEEKRNVEKKQLNFEMEQKEKEVFELKRNVENLDNLTFIAYLIIITFLITFIFIIIIFKKNKKEKKLLAEKNKLSANKILLSNIIESSLDNNINLNDFLQNVLESILKVSELSIKNQGAIFIKNQDGNLEMSAQKNIGIHRIKHCSLIKYGECICGKAFAEKKNYIGDFRSKFEKNNNSIAYIHMKKPIILGEEIFGILNLYIEKEQVIKKENIEFFDNICISLANIIKKKQLQETLEYQKKEQDILNQKLFAQSLEVDQRNFELFEQKEEIVAQTEKIKKQNLELQKSKEIYKAVITNMDDVFYRANIKQELTLISPSALRYTNIKTIDEMIGKNVPEMFYYNPDDRLKLLEDLKKNGGKIKNYEILIKNKDDNTAVPFETNSHFIYDKKGNLEGVEGILRDITERKKTEELIKLSEKKYRTLFEKSRNATLILKNGKFIVYNKAAKILFGIKKPKLEISPEMLSPKYQKDRELSKTKAEKNITIALKEGFYKFEWTHKHLDNTEFPSEVWLTSIPYENTTALHTVIIDLTDTKRKQKLLKLQKQKIEIAHKNITDSINYAETIQNSLLTSKNIIDNYIKEYFIFFKPKEKVSGDFYYVNKIDKHIIFAAADCTGHGVPGGFLTMLGITYLHEIIKRETSNNPAIVLEMLRERFKNTFMSFGSKNSSGLDIALCSINTETNILQYAGAYNPLLIIRNKKLIEYKATRNPIGFYPREKKFKNNKIELQNNDIIYIYSDGFQDQFSEIKNKKFMSKKFKKLLLKIHNLPMKKQENKLKDIFMKWKGKREQTDDVIIFAMKFNQNI